MEYEVGDRVMQKSSDEWGIVQATRQTRVLLVEAQWSTGVKQWLPADQLRPFDKAQTPPPVSSRKRRPTMAHTRVPSTSRLAAQMRPVLVTERSAPPLF